MTIVWGVKAQGNGWSSGHVLVPRTGKIYDVQLKLSADGKSLAVRGYSGTPMLGKTQTWRRDQ